MKKAIRIAVGSDHAGVRRKAAVLRHLRSRGHAVEDVGPWSEEAVDYPDFARLVAAKVARRRADKGVLLCGTGIGMAIAANKIAGVRAAPVWSEKTARLAAEHNDANILCLSARLFAPKELRRMLDGWLTTPFGGGRHLRRVRKIRNIEKRSKGGKKR